MAQSPLVGLTITPHIVHVGQTLHMVIAGECDHASGGCPAPHPLSGLANCPGATNPPGAVGHANFCFKAVAETGGWQAPFTSSVGPPGSSCPPAEQLGPMTCAASTADYYLVDNSLFELSGKVQLAPREPAAGVPIELTGERHERTVTDAHGEYLFALPKGNYTVRPTRRGFIPNRHSFHLTHDVTHADFESDKPRIELEGNNNQQFSLPDNAIRIGQRVFVHGYHFRPYGGRVKIALDGKQLIHVNVERDGDFTATFVLGAFPGRRCSGTVDAKQGRAHAEAGLPGSKVAEVRAEAGGVILTGRTFVAEPGDMICRGEDPQKVADDSVTAKGKGLIDQVFIPGSDEPLPYYDIASRPQGAADIVYHGFIESDHGQLIVQMPDGTRTLPLFGRTHGNPATTGCTSPPAADFTAPASPSGCWNASGGLIFEKGLTLMGSEWVTATSAILISGGLHCTPDASNVDYCALDSLNSSLTIQGGLSYAGNGGEVPDISYGLLANNDIIIRG